MIAVVFLSYSVACTTSNPFILMNKPHNYAKCLHDLNTKRLNA